MSAKTDVDSLYAHVERELLAKASGPNPDWQQVARVAVDAVLERQRSPRCSECDDPITFVPRSGFGNTGEWQHRGTPMTNPGHLPRPRLFIDPPPRAVSGDGFLGC